jgi:hypothetical protein
MNEVPQKRQIVDEVIYHLRSADKRAVVLKGEWGQGKTYFWNSEILPVFQKEGATYISLFGIQTIEALKSKLYMTAVDRDITIQEKLIRGGANLLRIGKGGLLRYAKARGVDPEILSLVKINFDLIDILPHGLMICLDDFERSDLNLKELLGLLDALLQRKDAKILILADETQMPEGHYQVFKEKVVKRTISVSTSIQEIFNSKIQSTQFLKLPENSLAVEAIREVILKCACQNLRIVFDCIEKVERLIALPDEGFSVQQISFVTALNIEASVTGRLEQSSKFYDYSAFMHGRLNPDKVSESGKQSIKFYEAYGLEAGGHHKLLYDYINDGYLSIGIQTEFRKSEVTGTPAEMLLRRFESHDWFFSVADDLAESILRDIRFFLSGEEKTTPETLLRLYAAYLAIIKHLGVLKDDFDIPIQKSLEHSAETGQWPTVSASVLLQDQDIADEINGFELFYDKAFTTKRFSRLKELTIATLERGDESFSIFEERSMSGVALNILEDQAVMAAAVKASPKSQHRFFHRLISALENLDTSEKNAALTKAIAKLQEAAGSSQGKVNSSRLKALIERAQTRIVGQTGDV